ncbi:MAG: glycosyltransferase family 2 protein [Muribaculaceae bacterium]
MLITVFTPTYNRAHLLGRVFTSLQMQTCRDFEWVIVDDGSTDNTEDVVNGFLAESGFPIRYFKQPNGGKHRAVNRGVGEARGEVFFIVDSDDSVSPNGLADIAEEYRGIRCDKAFAGVSGCMASHSGVAITPMFPTGSRDFDDVKCIDCNALDIRYEYCVEGDLAEVFRTGVLREFPFPEFDGEKFCPEALVWNRIAQKYKLRYFNRIIYHRDYLPDGLTKRIVRIRMDSPMASTTHYSELNSYSVPWAQKLKAAINYWRFWFCLNDKTRAPKLACVWYFAKPLGWLMHLRDRYTTR